MIKKFLISMAIVLFIITGVSYSSEDFRSDYDITWDVTVIDCNGKETKYENVHITQKEGGWINIVTENRKAIKINTSSACTSVMFQEAD